MAKMARAKVDLLSPKKLSAIYRNQCPRITETRMLRGRRQRIPSFMNLAVFATT